jgi:hypothetical protein
MGEGLKILGKIELPGDGGRKKFPYEKVRNEFIQKFEENFPFYVEKIRNKFLTLGVSENFINKDMAISGEAYKKSNGGIYKDVWVDDDKKYIDEQNKEVFNKEANKHKDGYLAEKILPFVLNKFFEGSEYIIVNTSDYDDNYNGIDHVIFNTETGKAICALDELVGNKEMYKDGERYSKKEDKIKNKLKKYGGGRLKYGAVFKKGRFEEFTPLKELPFAILRVERKLMYQAMQNMSFDDSMPVHESEKEFIKDTLHYLEKQVDDFKQYVEDESVYNPLLELVEFLKQKTQ